MKQKAWFVIIAILFLGGIGLALYPMVSELVNSRVQQQLVESYQDKVSEIQEEDLSEEWKRAFEYNANLSSGSVVLSEPFDETKFIPSEENYKSVLNLDGSGVMGHIEIPEISVNLAIYHTVEEDVLRSATGHLPGTSLPVGGESTHSVLSSHRGVAQAKLFTDLDKLTIGDVFYIHVLDEVLAYEVDEINVVEPEDVSKLAVVEGEDYVTLVTCTPYSVNTHRLLVRGSRTEYVAQDYDSQSKKNSKGLPYGWQGLLIIFPAIAALIIILIIRKRK